MLVETKTLGTLEIKEEQIISIPKGLFGFEEYVDFALIDSEYKPFIWLQSLKDKTLALLLLDPFLVDDTYEADIGDTELAKIGLSDARDVMLLTVVTVPAAGGPVTANFQGPLVINKRNKLCMQVILNNPNYTTKHDIAASILRKMGRKRSDGKGAAQARAASPRASRGMVRHTAARGRTGAK